MLANAVILAADLNLTDSAIISSVLQGKTDQYEILVRRYNQQLYKSARGILSDESDIEDVMQEAYIKGFEKLHQFRNEAKFSTWLTRILINCALQQAARLKGKQNISLDGLTSDDLEDMQFEDERPPQEISDNLKKTLEAAISHLPAKYRVVFILREIEQKPVIETSQILNITEENVKVRLHRAKGMLKEMLKSELNALEIFEFHAVRCARVASIVMNRVSALVAGAH